MKSNVTFAILIIIGIVIAVLVLYLFPQKTEDATIFESDIMETREMVELTLTSSAFEHNGSIPSVYSCDGENVNPPLTISGVPEGTVTLALIVDDPDIPDVVKKSRLTEKFDHWLVYNIPAKETEIDSPYGGKGTAGVNSIGERSYTGPCPPTEYEPTEHRYVFQLYALDSDMPLREGANEQDLRDVMKGHILAKAELIGLFDRANKD